MQSAASARPACVGAEFVTFVTISTQRRTTIRCAWIFPATAPSPVPRAIASAARSMASGIRAACLDLAAQRQREADGGPAPRGGQCRR
ncbi:MAG: hypothetical protein REU00_13065, partial [Pseudomonadota bacterium]|nr:hypothetical protein [Pseudomonadota bacterium]